MLTHTPASHVPLTPQQLETNSGELFLAEGAGAMPTHQKEGYLGSFQTG